MTSSSSSLPLYLASTSRYRHELLSRLGLPFTCIAPINVDERAVDLPPRELVVTLARMKAQSVAATLEAGVVIGSDQVGALDDVVLTKPGTPERAFAQLRSLAGREHQLLTGVCVVDAATGEFLEHLDVHRMRMRQLTDAQIAHYVETEKPLDCAGSYKIERLGIALMEELEGCDFTAVVGLPLAATTAMLSHFGVDVLSAQVEHQ